MLKSLRKFLIGAPLDSAQALHERFSVPKGLAILSADALSSVAYAGEEILHVLVPVIGLAAFNYLTPIAIAIALLLFIVSFSYRQIIDAFPKSSGGAYIVAKHNIGAYAGLVAGAALLFDYVLTVAVSISAGVAAFTSAYHPAIPYTVPICLTALLFLLIMNLRGVTEAATIFSYPTFAFIIGMFLLLILGFFQITFLGKVMPHPVTAPPIHTSLSTWAFIWLILRAFSSGCAALTGVEAVSNAVPNFKEPENKNAKAVLTTLAILLFTMFGGLAILTRNLHIVPTENMTVISQVAQSVFGQGIIFYLFQASTFLILILAANTAFSGFPLLASLMAKDGYLPRYMALRGDKLVYSNGIIGLGILSGILIYLFGGITTRLIPLYAVGVFTSFTLAQTAMVKKWLHSTVNKRYLRLFINGLGAVTTGIVLLVIAVTKFVHGAWIVIIFIPVMVYFLQRIKLHYQDVREQLDFDNYLSQGVKHKIIIPVASLTNVVANTIDYAKTLSDDVQAVHVSIDADVTAKFEKKWNQWNPGIELVVIPSPYRSVFEPLVKYIVETEGSKQDSEIVTVLIPEFITHRWWHRFLHNHTALILQNLLVFHSDIVVTAVPYHLLR